MYAITLRTFSLVLAATISTSVLAQSTWWQFVMKGPTGERQVSPHYRSENECNAALKITETWLAKKYPERYPLVGSCEAYR
jgi:hypothetical protein